MEGHNPVLNASGHESVSRAGGRQSRDLHNEHRFATRRQVVQQDVTMLDRLEESLWSLMLHNVNPQVKRAAGAKVDERQMTVYEVDFLQRPARSQANYNGYQNSSFLQRSSSSMGRHFTAVSHTPTSSILLEDFLFPFGWIRRLC